MYGNRPCWCFAANRGICNSGQHSEHQQESGCSCSLTSNYYLTPMNRWETPTTAAITNGKVIFQRVRDLREYQSQHPYNPRQPFAGECHFRGNGGTRFSQKLRAVQLAIG